MDGTFRTSPEGYEQLYMIHGIIDEQNVPPFYCILKKKDNDVVQGGTMTTALMTVR